MGANTAGKIRGNIGKGLFMALAAAGIASAPALSQATLPALYTQAQASDGAALYARHCAACHGPNLEGTSGPALKGPLFQQMAAQQKLTPATLQAVTGQSMPQGAPSSLPREQYAAITAYILQQNGYPAGNTLFVGDSACTACTAPLSTGTQQVAAAGDDHGAATAASAGPETIIARPVTANVDVTDTALLNADKDLDNWLLYGRTYDNQRFSPLTQITAANVKRLRPVAIIQTGMLASFEASPIIVNGVMYIVTASDHVQAYDAVTGRNLWNYTPRLGYSSYCCGPVSRGVAVAYGKVFVAQIDGRVAALDARTGAIVWRTDAAATLPSDPSFYSFTLAPQVYDGKVIVGSSGAEWPTRGFVQAYDAATGKLLWRFHTIAAPNEPGGKTWEGDSWKYGGGSVWNTPAIDPATGLIAFGVGNPNPDTWGEGRKGDNAYTDSIVAISAATGKLAWWHQMVPHDVWDYDAAAPVVFFDADDGHGKMVSAAGEASKEGHLFIVDRKTGKLIRRSEPFVLESANKWAPVGDKPVTIYPAVNGGNIWSPAAFSPLTHYFYVPGTNQAWTYTAEKVDLYVPGTPVVGQRIGGHMKAELDPTLSNAIPSTGNLSAIDVNTGKIAWQYKSELPMEGGVLATASNLVFSGEMTGDFNAFDARTGEKLWHFYLGTGVTAPPVTYRVNGVQYVAVAAGGLGTGGMARLTAGKGLQPYGDVVAIFALPDSP